MVWKSDSIRSIVVDYDNLSDFMGRNPNGVYSEEDLVTSLREAIRSGGELYFNDPRGGERYRLGPGPEEGTYRFTSAS